MDSCISCCLPSCHHSLLYVAVFLRQIMCVRDFDCIYEFWNILVNVHIYLLLGVPCQQLRDRMVVCVYVHSRVTYSFEIRCILQLDIVCSSSVSTETRK